MRELIALATAAGSSSHQIGLSLGKSGSYIRHVRAKRRAGQCGKSARAG